MNELREWNSGSPQDLLDDLAALSIEQRLGSRIVTIDDSFRIEAEQMH